MFYRHHFNFETKMRFLCKRAIAWSHEELLFSVLCERVSGVCRAGTMRRRRNRHYFKWIQSKLREKEKFVVGCLRPQKKLPIRKFVVLRPCYTWRFAATIFSATQRCNAGIMLQLFEKMSQQCCSALLRSKSSFRIVSCNITFSASRFG